MFPSLIDWFMPTQRLVNRTDKGLARVFVFTHIFGPTMAQPMWIYIWLVSGKLAGTVAVLMACTAAFWTLAFLLRRTANIQLVSMLSFQLLALTSLFASYHFGGFNSPFLQWLIVSLLLGLFYHAKNSVLVLTIFFAYVLAFGSLVWWFAPQNQLPVEQLEVLRWLSVASAAIYMTWMALYYSRVVGLRAELESEFERSRETFHQLQEARARKEALVRRRAKFFSKISHELRTPLNAIIGYSEILIEELDDRKEIDPNSVRDVSRIMAAGKHLLSLVSRVLDSKMIASNEEHVDITAFSLGALCDEVVASALPMVEKNKNRFIVTCENRDYVLESDATRLRQIFLNLLSNAAKFTSQGVVRFELEIVQRETGEFLQVAVADTGIGMSAEAAARVFREYEQAEIDTARKYGGTGIGLPLSQQLCNLLGGDIALTSSPGQGSCFVAAVPAQYRATSELRQQPHRVSAASQPSLNPSARHSFGDLAGLPT